MRLYILAALGCAALCFLPRTARADWTANPDGSWTLRADAGSTPADKPACVCGDDCKCGPGDCPGKCPVESVAADAYETRCYTDPRTGRTYCVRVKVAAPNADAAAKVTAEACEECAASASPSRSFRGPVRRIFGRLFRGGCCG